MMISKNGGLPVFLTKAALRSELEFTQQVKKASDDSTASDDSVRLRTSVAHRFAAPHEATATSLYIKVVVRSGVHEPQSDAGHGRLLYGIAGPRGAPSGGMTRGNVQCSMINVESPRLQ